MVIINSLVMCRRCLLKMFAVTVLYSRCRKFFYSFYLLAVIYFFSCFADEGSFLYFCGSSKCLDRKLCYRIAKAHLFLGDSYNKVTFNLLCILDWALNGQKYWLLMNSLLVAKERLCKVFVGRALKLSMK